MEALTETTTLTLEVETTSLTLRRLSALNGDVKRSAEKGVELYRRLAEEYAPWYVVESGKIRLFFPKTEKNSNMERILRYWNEGFRHSVFLLPVAFYLFAREFPERHKKVRELLTWKQIDQRELVFLRYLFLSEEVAERPAPAENVMRLSRNTFRSWKLVNLKKITRKDYRNLLQKNEKLIIFFENLLLQKSTLMLKGAVERQHLWHNNEKLCIKAGYGKAEEVIAILEERGTFPSASQLQDLLENTCSLNNKAGKVLLHAILMLRGDTGKTTELQQLIKDFELPCPHWRRTVFFAAARNEMWEEALALYPQLRKKQEDLMLHFYYARALFMSGQKETAWETIFSLWSNFPENPAIMNEAAIYAYHLGRKTEAEDIYNQLKLLYPSHAATLHNEAVFYEKKAVEEVNEKWKTLEETSNIEGTTGDVPLKDKSEKSKE